MRPPSIIGFERAYLASIVLGLFNAVLSWQSIAASVDDPRLQAAGLGPNFLVGSIIVSTIISVLLWYFIAKRASVVAKWIFVVLLVLSIVGLAMNLANPAIPGGIDMVLSVVGVLLQLYAGWMLFQPDAKAWLSGERADPATFD